MFKPQKPGGGSWPPILLRQALWGEDHPWRPPLPAGTGKARENEPLPRTNRGPAGRGEGV